VRVKYARRPRYRLNVSVWSSVVTPGLVAAGVTTLLYLWIQRPRANLRMARINQTVDVAEWLWRAGTDEGMDAEEAKKHWHARDTVLLTNYGDGIAYDIKLSGTNCRPRVRVRDMGRQEAQDAPPVAGVPMWSDQLSALEPGKMMSVVVMSSPDQSLPRPVLVVSWSRLPGRLPMFLAQTRLGRKRCSYDLATARTVETGWPGKKDIPSD